MTGLSLAAGNKAHPARDRGLDLYETPAVAVNALLEVEKLPHHIWEPACGRGAIVNILRACGHTVWASDIADYGCPNSQSGINFLTADQARFDVEAIVTNPPFAYAAEFIEQALFFAPKVIMLLRLNFLEGHKKPARRRALDGGKLARVHVFRNRLPMMHRDGWEGPKASSGMVFAWFVWDRFHVGKAELSRVTWHASNHEERIAA